MSVRQRDGMGMRRGLLPVRRLSLAGALAAALLAFGWARPATGQARAQGSHAAAIAAAKAADSAAAPIPDLGTLMQQVAAHQKELDKIRENYTYRSLTVNQYLDGHGKVTKTESEEDEVFFVRGHEIERVVAKNGKPLSGHDADKEQERVTKAVEKAQQTPEGQPVHNGGQTFSVSDMLSVMEVSHPRRVLYNGRSTLEFDVTGRRDAKAHGLAEGAMKRVAGSIWIDEKDRQVAHLEIRFMDNFRVGGGLLANIQKGSEFHFEQALVNNEIWLPTGAEGTIDARLMLFKGLRQHFTEQDSQYKRFQVETKEGKSEVTLP